MRSCIHAVAALLVAAAWGSGAPQSSEAQNPKLRKDASGIEACALLTVEEIEAAAGWKPEAADPDKHGTTATCNYHRADGAKVKSIVLVISPGLRVLESSAAMAKWRSESVARHPELKIVVEPVEGLDVPAISSRSEDDPVPTLEASAKGVLVAVRGPSLEVSKVLAGKAIARLP